MIWTRIESYDTLTSTFDELFPLARFYSGLKIIFIYFFNTTMNHFHRLSFMCHSSLGFWHGIQFQNKNI